MCGLTGFAAHPEHGGTAYAKLLLADLLLSIQKRGKQATGIAATGGKDGFIYKIALPANVVVQSHSFATALDRIKEQTVVLGHTRNAFVSDGEANSHLDACAHPFHIGKVVGAHNGVIYNWREIMRELAPHKPWLVDSQAIFALLNEKVKPETALEELVGYFALSWVKNRKLFLARSEAAPLSAAYVPSIRTLFWHSELPVLEQVFKESGLKEGEYEKWGLRQGVIYSYDPRKFTETGTGVERCEVEFKKATGRRHLGDVPAGVGLSRAGSGKKGNGSDSRDRRYYDWGDDDDSGYRGYDPTGISRRWQSSANVGLSNERESREPLPEARRLGRGQLTLQQMRDEMAALRARVKELERAQDSLIQLLQTEGVLGDLPDDFPYLGGDEPPLDESQADIFDGYADGYRD